MKKRKETIVICLVAGIFLSTSLSMADANSNNLDEGCPFSPVIYERFVNLSIENFILGLDIENDGDTDFISGSGTYIYYWENKGEFDSYKLIHRLERGDNGSNVIQYGGLASGDINHDDYIDLIVGGSFGELRILQNEKGTDFSEIVLWEFPQDLFAVDVVDWNNDGLNDIVAGYTYATPMDSRVSLILNQGDGVFAEPVEIYQIEARMFSDVHADDFDNDGDIDVLIAYSDVNYAYFVDGNIVLLKNDGTNNFTPLVVSHRGDGEYHGDWETRIHPRLAIADYDMDGDPDIAFGDNSGIVELLWNNGDATFQEALVLCDLGEASRITDTDYDLDGDIDIVVSTGDFDLYRDGGFYVIFNNINPMSMQTPQPNHLYLFDNQLDFGDSSMLIGPTTFRINRQVDTDYVEFYVNDKLMHTDNTYPFEWKWSKLHFGEANVEIIGYFADGTTYTLQEHHTKIF